MPGLLRLPLRLHPGPLLFGPGEATVHSLHPLPLSFLWIPALRDLHRKSECSRMVSGLAACLSSQPGLAAAASTPLRPQFLVPHLLPPRRGPQARGGGRGRGSSVPSAWVGGLSITPRVLGSAHLCLENSFPEMSHLSLVNAPWVFCWDPVIGTVC